MNLTVGPILYYWPKASVEHFYAELKQTKVDTIYLGETVCGKRHQLKLAEWIELAKYLAEETGKEIILSSFALLESNSELLRVKKLCQQQQLLIEANDMSAVQLLSSQGIPFVCGPAINIYNHRTLLFLHRLGMKRWVMPVELNRDSLAEIMVKLAEHEIAIETEVFSYGHLPLAYSARCFTARAHDLPKDDCQYKCLEYPQGMEMSTQDEQQLFTINGIQTMSGHYYNLINELNEMKQLGVSHVRISPQLEGILQIIEQFTEALTEQLTTKQPLTAEQCNGYWYGDSGLSVR